MDIMEQIDVWARQSYKKDYEGLGSDHLLGDAADEIRRLREIVGTGEPKFRSEQERDFWMEVYVSHDSDVADPAERADYAIEYLRARSESLEDKECSCGDLIREIARKGEATRPPCDVHVWSLVNEVTRHFDKVARGQLGRNLVATRKNDHCYCPECDEFQWNGCKCNRGDRRCSNGHRWHRCIVHRVKVSGQSDRSRPSNVCTCPEANTYGLTRSEIATKGLE